MIIITLQIFSTLNTNSLGPDQLPRSAASDQFFPVCLHTDTFSHGRAKVLLCPGYIAYF